MNACAPVIASDSLHLSLPASCQSEREMVQSIALPRCSSDAVQRFLAASISENSRKAYQSDLSDFIRWGGRVPCEPATLAAFIASRANTLSAHTISRRIAGISHAHIVQDLPDPAKTPLVRAVLRGLRRLNGRPQRRVSPLLKDDLLRMLPFMRGLKGLRDRALILTGFSAALRRSELVALKVEHIRFETRGILITLPRSKTDQTWQGRNIAVPHGRAPLCPVEALSEWLTHSRIQEGPIFRPISRGNQISTRQLTAQSVALILKAYATAAGFDAKNVSGHSLRSGFVTCAAQARLPLYRIQQQTGHRSLEMLARYIRMAPSFDNSALGASWGDS